MALLCASGLKGSGLRVGEFRAYRVSGSLCGLGCLGIRVQGSGFRVQGLGLGFRV